MAAGFYTTNSAEACKFVALNADCSVIVVENDFQLQKILSIRAQLPKLKAIVQYKGKVKAAYDNVYTVSHTHKHTHTIDLLIGYAVGCGSNS